MKINTETDKQYQSHGNGKFTNEELGKIGTNVIIENDVMLFHPKNIFLGNNVYIGHRSILKAYHKNTLEIGDNSWIGQGCFFHSAGGLKIGKAVGIGPNVTIITSAHEDNNINLPILFHDLKFKEVIIEDGADIGVASIILPGIIIGQGAIIGAGSVVTKDVPAFTVVAGNPARELRVRK
jgi:acetyltransferase-like isoleucine patch superfamily enzyme